MLYTFDSSSKANSTVQIMTGTIKEVAADTVTVTVPVGYNNEKEFKVQTASLKLPSAPTVGMPVAAFGLDCEDGTFEVNAELQKKIAAKATQMVEFDRCKTNVSTKKKSMEHNVFMMFPLSKASQIQIDEEKKCVRIPANVGNTTVWLRFYANQFNHFENYEKDNKKRLGIKSYAQMLQKQLENLTEDGVMLISYTGRFEDSEKGADGKYTYSPAAPQEKDGKLVYSVFGNGESAMGTMLNTAVVVNKSCVYTAKASEAPVVPEAQEAQAPAPDLSEEEEMALLQQAMSV